ncbi:MAG: hypothetical protein V3G42_01105 [Oscillospiraceae bacterium]
MSFVLQLYEGENFQAETICTAVTVEKEVYSPLSTMSAVFVSNQTYGAINRVELYFQGKRIFRGLCRHLERFFQNGCEFLRISAQSFSSLLAQNQMEKGLHSNVTLSGLLNDFAIPWVTCEENQTSGYIFIKDGSLWDSIVSFGYKITGHYPFMVDNEIRISPPALDANSYSVNSGAILSKGTFFDTSQLISHFHMEGLDESPNAYQKINPPALAAGIVRHQQIPFDREFLNDPNSALTFRCLRSQKGCQGKSFSYSGFQGEELGERVTVDGFLQNAVICDLKVNYSSKGLVTKIRCYQDGFYSC